MVLFPPGFPELVDATISLSNGAKHARILRLRAACFSPSKPSLFVAPPCAILIVNYDDQDYVMEKHARTSRTDRKDSCLGFHRDFWPLQRIGYWRSDYDVWNHAVEVTKDNPLAEANLARTQRSLGRQQESLPHYQEAARLTPRDPIRHVNLAVDLAECGQLQDAVTEYSAAIRFISDPTTKARTYESLAALHGALGDYSKARENYKEALQTDSQQGPEMIQHLSQSVAAQPSSESYLQFGMLLQQTGRLPEARVAYTQALTLDPTLTEARTSLDALGKH